MRHTSFATKVVNRLASFVRSMLYGIGRGRSSRGVQEARSKKQEARGKKQEARSKRQEARSKKQEARGKKQEARGKKRRETGLEYEFTLKELKPQPVMSIRGRTTVSGIPATIGEFLPEVRQYVQNAGGQFAGPSFTRYHNISGNEVELEAGLPVVHVL